MKYLKKFNENVDLAVDSVTDYPVGFSVTMRENPELAIQEIDENPNILTARRGAIFKMACSEGYIKIVKHILDHHFNVVSNVMDKAIFWTETSLIDDNKKDQIIALLNSK